MKLPDFFTQRNRDFKKVFGTEEGERVLGHIYKMCGMNKQIHVPGDSYDSAFNAGKHRIGQGIQGILSQDEEDIFEILKGVNRLSTEKPQTATIFDPFNNNQGEA